MTKDDCKTLVRAVKSLYPNWKIDNPSDTVSAWFYVVAEQDKNLCMSALKAYTLTDYSGFPPSPGQLLRQAQKVDTIPENEAWSLVQKAISRSGYYAEQEWEKLPPQVRLMITPQILRSWSLAEDFDPSVAMGQFHRYYMAAQERRSDVRFVPQDTRKVLTDATVKEQDYQKIPMRQMSEKNEKRENRVDPKWGAVSLQELMTRKKRELEEAAERRRMDELEVSPEGEAKQVPQPKDGG